MSKPTEVVEALPLVRKRRLLGILIPAINGPLFFINLYQTYSHMAQGMQLNTPQFFNDLIFLAITFGMSVVFPIWIHVYESKYRMEEDAFVITRLLRAKKKIPYRDIKRAEVYIKTGEEVSEDALKYSKASAEKLRTSGFKFKDYTNSEESIVMLIAEDEVYLISPAKPKNVIKRLKGRKTGKFTVKIVELTSRGKRIRELG